ncbi:hypothetical protein GA840_07305 [Pediococcus ethanolidurans]|nr:hypothetical protein [Pediococcus ethanolidurans]
MGDLVEKIRSYSLSRNFETKTQTNFKYIHYGDIHTGKVNKITNTNVLPNITAGTYDFLEYGDVVVADASEDYEGIAEPSVVLIKDNFKIVSGLHTIALRPIKIQPLYLYYLLHTRKFKKFGKIVGTGMKVFGISYSNLAQFSFHLPVEKKEQIKILSLINNLDDLIAANQRQQKSDQFIGNCDTS